MAGQKHVSKPSNRKPRVMPAKPAKSVSDQADNRFVFLSKPSAVPVVDVLLNGRKVGGLQFSVNDGWRYLPGGKVKNAGEWFPTFEAVVADITGVEPEQPQA